MFQTWLKENDVRNFTFDGSKLFPAATDRRFWSKKVRPGIVENAEQYLNYSWPEIKATDYMAFNLEGERAPQETPHFARREALMQLAVAELLEYKGRFLPDIVNGIFAICEETYWGVSAHGFGPQPRPMLPSAAEPYIDLFAAETGELIAVICYLLQDALKGFCPEILERAAYELDRRIRTPFLAHADYWWMGYTSRPNNWNPWISSNILTVFLLTETDRERFNTALKKNMGEIQHYYQGLPEDGACDEGIAYWKHAGGKLFEYCDQLYRVTDGKIDFFGDPKLRKVSHYPFYAYVGDNKVLNFADGTLHTDKNMEYITYMFGQRAGNPQLSALSKELLSYHVPYEAIKEYLYALIYEADIQAQPPYVPGSDYFLPCVQVASHREGKWYCGAKGGSNGESHNHNDVGNFGVFYDKKPVLIDPGTGMYVRMTFSDRRYEIPTMQSAWHNVPMVNGCMQPVGKAAAADSFVAEGGNMTCSFAGAYPAEAGITALTRQITADAEGVTVTDRFAFTAAENEVREHFITAMDVEKADGKVILGGEFALTADRAVDISVDSLNIAGDKKLEGNWETTTLKRICFAFSAGQDAAVTVKLRKI